MAEGKEKMVKHVLALNAEGGPVVTCVTSTHIVLARASHMDTPNFQ